MTDEHEVVDELRDLVARTDPVPEAVLHAARGSFTWRTIDAELAQLAYDSDVDADRFAGVRSVGSNRRLAFETPSLTIELDVEPAPEGHRIRGQLAPPQEARVTLRHAGGETAVDADAVGRFTADGIATGPLGVRCELEDGTVVVTEWLAL